MQDKMQRIEAYLKSGKLEVPGEGVDDAFRDLIGYSCLALGMLKEAFDEPNFIDDETEPQECTEEDPPKLISRNGEEV